jgi:hypothetical protein
MQGKTVDCIRIRKPTVTPKKKAKAVREQEPEPNEQSVSEELDDAIPFA